ncbi:unnamed protein product [Cuscuta europaea]|uniref:SWIM-type domain-containing protein n=1 Tax=Cuscuta europaea TaxID=41803 RepID=A0A9P0Z8N0_CUSEU|nr:unnamed protein product [Cuscuta europaea]
MKPHLSSIHLLNFSPAVEFQMHQWFSERSEATLKTSTLLSNKCESHLVALQSEYTRLQVKPSSIFEFEVVDRKCRSFGVDLTHKTCTCGVFQLDQFVCVHAVASIHMRPSLSCYSFISPYYSRDAWLSIWTGTVHPIPDPHSWSLHSHISSIPCKPPLCVKRTPGRPKKSRTHSVGEFNGSKHQRCSRCRRLGHNKKSYRNPVHIQMQPSNICIIRFTICFFTTSIIRLHNECHRNALSLTLAI